MHDLKETISLAYGIKLLYVEDNLDARESTLEVLSEFFDSIEIAIDGIDGLDKFNSQKIDLIITDINMPNMDGMSMIEEIRKKNSDIPILLLSAYSEIEYFIKSIKLGVDGYLFKPIELEQFLDVLHKVIEKIQLQKKLSENLNFLQQYQEVTDESAIVCKTDKNGLITHVNDTFCKISSYTQEELMGASQEIVQHPDNNKKIFQDLFDRVENQKKSWRGIVRNISKLGITYYVDMTVKPILNENGEIIEHISICHNITDIMNQKKQLNDFIYSAKSPFLYEVKIEHYSDIEKYYSDFIAQQIENELYAQLLLHMPQKEYIFESFMLGNGEYFFVKDLNGSESIEEMIKSIQAFQRKINDLVVHIEEVSYDVSIIISVAYGDDVYENVKYGIERLEQNKKNFIIANGMSNRVHEEAKSNFEILKKIKYAIENENILSYFQPIVNRDGIVCKYESLVRLVDINDSVMAPFFFLEIAKKAKYYTQITLIVLKNSFEALGKTDKMISINLSAIDIEKNQLREEIYKLLELHKEEAHRLVFELLEDEDFKDFEVLKAFIERVKSYGVQIAIDDFGSGYSNFVRLLDYQPNIIKIDGSIVKNVESSTFSVSVIESVLLFAKSQKIEVVAEFVANEKIYEILKNLGVDYFQGYYFGKPEVLQVRK